MNAKQRQAKAKELAQAVAAMGHEGVPTTIAENGEVTTGVHDEWLNHTTDDMYRYVAAQEYGGCLYCSGNDGPLWVGREAWGICEQHQVKWLGAIEEPETNRQAWKKAEAELAGYQISSPAIVEVTIDYSADTFAVTATKGAGITRMDQDCPHNRLWAILRHSSGWTRKELRWLMANGDLTDELEWFVHRLLRKMPKP
jgi:hypothetical protein